MPASPEHEHLSARQRSVLRHRPIHTTDDTQIEVPHTSRASRSYRYDVPRTSIPKITEDNQRTIQPRGGRHRLLYLGLGMLLTLLLVLVGQWCIQNINQLSDNIRYGNPRTFQIDAFVGNEPAHTPSHFIALNLQGRIEVIELPGGDLAHAQRYQITHLDGPGAAQTPVTIHFVNSGHTKYADMVVEVQQTQFYLHNVNGVFHLA